MARGGFRPGAGRKKGTATKAAKGIAAAEQSLKSADPASRRFKTAADFCMDLINDPIADVADKIRAAQIVIPYQCPKLADIAPGKKEQQADKAKATASNRFAVPSAPKLVVDNK